MTGQAMGGLPLSRSGLSALEVALRVAEEAGRTLVDKLHGEKQVSHKGRANLVSDVDKLAERQIIAGLRREFPDAGFLAEESEPVASNSGYTWIIDPLDGTRNYVMEIPFFSMVIALAKGDDLLLGLTYDPVRRDMFQAVKGQGAFLNGEPIHVSAKTELEQALLGYDLGYVDEAAGAAIEMMLRLWPNLQGMRMMGSAALGLAYAACGKWDLYFHHSLAPWDLASGLLLVREAGGVVTDKHAGPATLRSESVIATGRGLHANFLKATEGMRWRR
ncbi:MAG: inositol-phosphate phosphatase [Dehalococcoidia bacterium]|nr:inositol-phosphate phosphatase [Dehalococcoidia bacterium]